MGAAKPSSWVCPHCDRPTTITDERQDIGWRVLGLGLFKNTWAILHWDAKRCPNPECDEMTLSVGVASASVFDEQAKYLSGQGIVGIGRPPGKATIAKVSLIPDSFSKPQPDYIPQPLREDYYEACKIRDLSPKAAATLARRCLQGIIRDFWGISKRTLYAEIDELKAKIDPPLWDALDAVRKVGNIGAHMQQDVNAIVSITPDEAQQLIELVEVLFEDFYVARHQREQRVRRAAALGKRKKSEKEGATTKTTPKASTP